MRACQAIGNDDDDDGAHFFFFFEERKEKKKFRYRNSATLSLLLLLDCGSTSPDVYTVNTHTDIDTAHLGAHGTAIGSTLFEM